LEQKLVLALALTLTLSPGERGQLRPSQFFFNASREFNVWLSGFLLFGESVWFFLETPGQRVFYQVIPS
jgi:hypothetical protein